MTYAPLETKPVINVECAINDSTAVITVSDNGKGIKPEIISRIFDSTFTTDRKEHFGLGLAIVMKMVEAHGGNVRAESDGPGKGASLVITIPNRLYGQTTVVVVVWIPAPVPAHPAIRS